jgi:hypothetical protein
VRQQIAQGLTNQRKELLKAALVETALNDAKIVNNLATNMLNNPSNLGLRPAADGATSSQPTQAPTQQQPATTPATTSSPVSVKPANANANTNK